MNQIYDRSVLEGALSHMESTALNFAHRFIGDGKVRVSYIRQARQLAQELLQVQSLQRKRQDKYRIYEMKFLRLNACEQVTSERL